jgi:beta-lactam-binding protein with PASTA domain
VTGDTPAQAAAALAQVGLTTQFAGTQSGMRVTSQAPTAGSRVPSGSTVVLTTS